MRLQIRSDDETGAVSGPRKWNITCEHNDSWDTFLWRISQTIGTIPRSVYSVSDTRRLIHPQDSSMTLGLLGIRDGDTLIVSQREGPHSPGKGQLLSGENRVHLCPPSLSSTVRDSKGVLTIRVMPDDNSCLFRAVAYVLLDKNREAGDSLRELAASIVSKPDSPWDEATLGMTPSQYAQWIRQPEHWGGAIELSIFATYFAIELASIDVASGRLDVFGEGSGYQQRAYLLYSGIHYDALAKKVSISETEDVTVFTADDDTVLMEVLEIAELVKAEHRYTDLAKFTLQCDQCGLALVGQREAQAHAIRSGHQRFSEYTA